MKIRFLAASLIFMMHAGNAFSQTSTIESGSFRDGGVSYNWTLNKTLVPDVFTNSDVYNLLSITSLPQGADFDQFYQAYVANLSNSTFVNKKNGADISPFLIGNGLLNAFPDEQDRINYINNTISFYSGGSYTVRDAGLILINGWYRTDPNSESEITVYQTSSPGFDFGRRLFALDDPWFYWYVLSAVYGPSPEDTLASFRPNALALLNTFNLQSAKIVQGLSYDCMVYDQKNICVSIIGANSDGKGFAAPSGALVVGYKLNDNIRFGAYVDQSFDSASFGGLATDKNDPGYGVYGAWSQNADGSGYQVRAAANISKVDIETTRVEVGFSEAGFGQSSIKSEGIQLDVARSYEINTAWSARPYVGYRKTTNSRSAYVETDSVEAPLSYNMLKQRTEMLVSGVTVDRQISTRTSLSLTAGVEHDLDNRIDSYQAVNEDIGDIEPIAMDSDVRKTRPSVSLGLNYDLGKAQRIGLSVSHRREAFSSESSTSGYVQYSIGF